jgi:hypothetical protein
MRSCWKYNSRIIFVRSLFFVSSSLYFSASFHHVLFLQRATFCRLFNCNIVLITTALSIALTWRIRCINIKCNCWGNSAGAGGKLPGFKIT